MAERVRGDGETEETRRLLAAAVEILPESLALRAFEAAADLDGPIDWRRVLLPPKSSKAEP
ncbi:hypothetical protein D3C86_1833440 [compost metagenome]